MSIARNVAASYLGRAYSIASIYVFSPFYLKFLGLAAYGMIGFYAIILAIGALVDAGLTATLSREVARSRNRQELLVLLATIERILLAASTAFAIIVALAAEFMARHWLNTAGGVTENELVSAIRLMAFTVPAQLGVSLYIGGILGMQKQGLGNALQALYVTVRGGLVIPLLAWAPSLELFFGWQLAASVLMLIVARIALVRAMGFGSFTLGHASLDALRPVARFAGGMFALTLLAGINTQLDKAVVSKIFTIAEFGAYSLASTLAQLPYAAVAPLMMAMLPRLTEMIGNGAEIEASAVYDRFSQIVAAIAGLGCFGLAFFAPEVLSVWLQAQHVPDGAVQLVRILAIGSLFLALSAPPFYLGLASGHNRTSVVAGIVTGVVSIPTLLIAADRFGLVGAAVPWILINVINFAALYANVHRQFYRGGSKSLLIAIGLSALGAAAMFLARVTATSMALQPLAACLLAGGFSLLVLGGLAFLHRDRLRAWSEAS